MPWANSRPVRPFFHANTASFASDTPASAVISPSPVSASCESLAEVSITTVSSPSSAISRFVPLPMSSGLTPASCKKPISTTSCSRVSGRAMRLAGPPMRNDVCFAIDSS